MGGYDGRDRRSASEFEQAIMGKLGDLSSDIAVIKVKIEHVEEMKFLIEKNFDLNGESSRKNASQDVEIERIDGIAKGAEKKIEAHIEHHWKFGAMIISLCGLFITAAKWVWGVGSK